MPKLKRLMGLSVAVALAGCNVDDSGEIPWDVRLADGDTTLCADKALNDQVFDTFARQSAENVLMLGGMMVASWEQERDRYTFTNVSASDFKPEIQELTCSGTLIIGEMQAPVSFKLRPAVSEGQEIVFETEDLSPIAQLLLAVELEASAQTSNPAEPAEEDLAEISPSDDAGLSDAAIDAETAAIEASAAAATAAADAAAEEAAKAQAGE